MAPQSASALQHPRRSLGNRHLAQAKKFLKLYNSSNQTNPQNLAWAEQSARQAVLYDFTNEDNWRLLVELKSLRSDKSGIYAVLEDLFTVLGRPPERLDSLKQTDLLEHGSALLEAAFSIDPLNPDNWWNTLTNDESKEIFATRMLSLDLRDPRANILFGRRIERFRSSQDEERFILLSTHLLSNRPTNHEAWTELGRLHERRREFDDAWLCYDQAQSHFPSLTVRDEFRGRMVSSMDSKSKMWNAPDLVRREEFLARMESLARRLGEPVSEVQKREEIESKPDEKSELLQLLESSEYQAAFFLARRIMSRGEDWAEEYLLRAKEGLD